MGFRIKRRKNGVTVYIDGKAYRRINDRIEVLYCVSALTKERKPIALLNTLFDRLREYFPTTSAR